MDAALRGSPAGAAETVVTISRQLASGGAYIGQRLAQRLGFRYVDREILTRAAAALGLDDEQSVAPLEEHAAAWWHRLSRGISIGAPDAPFTPPPPPTFDEGDVIEVESQIIREIAAAGSVVIVGRGAPHVLAGRDNVIRVFVHAPRPDRIAEVQRAYHLDEPTARAMVERSDKARSRFIQSLAGRSWTDACLYHLTIDTSVFPRDQAVELLVSAVHDRGHLPLPPAAA